LAIRGFELDGNACENERTLEKNKETYWWSFLHQKLLSSSEKALESFKSLSSFSWASPGFFVLFIPHFLLSFYSQINPTLPEASQLSI
jgi:hypothetical protein